MVFQNLLFYPVKQQTKHWLIHTKLELLLKQVMRGEFLRLISEASTSLKKQRMDGETEWLTPFNLILGQKERLSSVYFILLDIHILL
jgi:hypothetical protein